MTDRISKQWVDVGFQGQDPATDFRGAGILGLDQLLAISNLDSPYHASALAMFNDSRKDEHWYFFACAGINMTHCLLDLLHEDASFDEAMLFHLSTFMKWKDRESQGSEATAAELFEMKKGDDCSTVTQRNDYNEVVLLVFNHLYYELFYMFNRKWAENKMNIMEFTQFFKNLYDNDFYPQVIEIINKYSAKLT